MVISMKKFNVGQRVRIGGSKGCIMTVSEINGKDMVLVDENSTFYFHDGDCTLIPVKDYEQLSLF